MRNIEETNGDDYIKELRPRPIAKLYQMVKDKTAVFLGCGPSINDITDEQWERIKTFNIWSINNWIYHPFIVPDFYHVELKKYDYYIFMDRYSEKKDLYAKTNFIFPLTAKVKLDTGVVVLGDDFPSSKKFVYAKVDRDPSRLAVERYNLKGAGSEINADYKFKADRVVKSYSISLTSLIEIMYRSGYKNIVMFGVDLYDSRYFWTGGDPKYGVVHHQTNKAHEDKDPNLPHNTHFVKNFIVDFDKRFMQPDGKRIYVGTKKTALYPDIEFIDIMDSRLDKDAQNEIIP